MKKHLFLMAALATGMVACTNDELKTDQDFDKEDSISSTQSKLTTVNLETFAGNQERITYAPTTRDENAETETNVPTLKLLASIDNPSKGDGFNFIKEEGGRWLSATSVYYDSKTQDYYVTYHMQGNNYNTTLDNEIGGAIQAFKVSENGDVTLGPGFRAKNPDKEDFDFNHLYFENTTSRIITVGHKWNVPSTWTSDEPYSGERDNTRAIIALFDPESATLKYSTIDTSEKAYDSEGKSLGYKDAGDANCVIRAGETMNKNQSGWDFYYVATRKGMAVLSAKEETLFEPLLNEDGTNYFIPTPGSSKFVARTGTSSFFDLLYLAEDKENSSYSQTSEARIAHFSTQTGDNYSLGFLKERGTNEIFKPKEKSILEHGDQINLPSGISPIDGKNTLLCAPDIYSDNENYAALGTSGMYYKFNGVNSNNVFEGVLEFKGSSANLPVNCVTADVSDMENGHDGFIYIACGSRLVILHRKTFELVAYWNIPSKDEAGNEIEASANYIHVEKAPANNNWEPRERIITVAFGQAGVKIFRFNPSTLEKKTVWEKELLPTYIRCNN